MRFRPFRKSSRVRQTPRARFKPRAAAAPTPFMALLISSALGLGRAPRAHANPQGMQVVSGQAAAASFGSHLQVQASHQAVLNWGSFNIGRNEMTSFVQPSAASIVWNQINDPNPSAIFGRLQANGIVVLANQNGFYFGPDSVVNAAGLIATTTALPPNPMEGGPWQFSGAPLRADIINYGRIETHPGGSAFLIARKIENHGTISAPQGEVGLHAGQEVLISERPDGRGLSARVRLPAGSVDNTGKLVADGGWIAAHAEVVNQNGLVQANSIQERNGVIELIATGQIELGNASQLTANGPSTGAGQGGEITVRSGGKFTDTPGSRLEARGGATGGNGGKISISAKAMPGLNSRLDASSANGVAGGLSIDPTDIVLSQTGAGTPGTGTVTHDQPPEVLRLNVTTDFQNFSKISLQAERDIHLEPNTAWNLTLSTGVSELGAQLTMEAGRDIVFGNNSSIIAGNWSLNLRAGVDFTNNQLKPGVGAIYLSGGSANALGQVPAGSGSIESGSGKIQLSAGHEVLVGSGFVRTVEGGAIQITTLTGDVNAGTKNDNFDYLSSGYRLSLAGLGGIATGKGGDVRIEAGRDIVSLPQKPLNNPSPGAVGAYGAEPADVVLSAGRRIIGNFLVRNGRGIAAAGVTVVDGVVQKVTNPEGDIGLPTNPTSLSLISGGWQAWAARDIFLSEIRNPSGTFNTRRRTVPADVYFGNLSSPETDPIPRTASFLFDYALDASVILRAGNSVHLLGANLPRVTGQNADMPAVYPPRLDVEAGAGGIEIRNDVVLFPSSEGALRIATKDGGDLVGSLASGRASRLIMSASSHPDFRSFTADQARTPIHKNNPSPPEILVSGSIRNLAVALPKRAEIKVERGTFNLGFSGQHLNATDVTRLEVVEDIRYRGNRTVVVVSEPVHLEVLVAAKSARPDIVLKMSYNPEKKELAFFGKMTPGELNFLLDPRVLTLDPFGLPILDANNQFVTESAVLTSDRAALTALFEQSQDASLADSGLTLSGPGTFALSARNMDLGISGGIESQNTPGGLVGVTPIAPNLEIRLSGNLQMTSSKINSIGLLGSIDLEVAGEINVGSQESIFNDTAKGIYTFGGGSIRVAARGDINVNGSRIATYNGGDIDIESREGNVNAGAGGLGFVTVNSFARNPDSGELEEIRTSIPGSGILATTLPATDSVVGSIKVKADQGDIIASKGGVLQLSFNKTDSSLGAIRLTAGRDIDAGDSGVIGGNVSLQAGRNVSGLVVASQNIDIDARQNVNVTALAVAGVNVAAGASVSGSIIGGSGASVSGASISGNVISQSASVSGDASSASIGVPQAATASTTQQAVVPNKEEAQATAAKALTDEEENTKSGKKPTLARTTGRVTVILPTGK